MRTSIKMPVSKCADCKDVVSATGNGAVCERCEEGVPLALLLEVVEQQAAHEPQEHCVHVLPLP